MRKNVSVPQANRDEAALVDGIKVYAVPALADSKTNWRGAARRSLPIRAWLTARSLNKPCPIGRGDRARIVSAKRDRGSPPKPIRRKRAVTNDITLVALSERFSTFFTERRSRLEKVGRVTNPRA